MVLNKHKTRYWLSVGAEPTDRAARLLSMFDMFPAPVTPWGKSTTYEKPKKRHAVLNFKDRFKLKLDAESDYA